MGDDGLRERDLRDEARRAFDATEALVRGALEDARRAVDEGRRLSEIVGRLSERLEFYLRELDRVQRAVLYGGDGVQPLTVRVAAVEDRVGRHFEDSATRAENDDARLTALERARGDAVQTDADRMRERTWRLIEWAVLSLLGAMALAAFQQWTGKPTP